MACFTSMVSISDIRRWWVLRHALSHLVSSLLPSIPAPALSECPWFQQLGRKLCLLLSPFLLSFLFILAVVRQELQDNSWRASYKNPMIFLEVHYPIWCFSRRTMTGSISGLIYFQSQEEYLLVSPDTYSNT